MSLMSLMSLMRPMHLMRRRRSLAVLALALAPCLAAGCKTNPSTGRSQLLLLSEDQVAAMGVEAKPQLVEQFGGEVESAELRAYVERVGRGLAAHVEPEFRDVQWDFTTLDSDVLNAFALPGGYVFITRGLLMTFSDEAEVAGVLGHEIGHVTARHIDERITQSLIAEFGLQVVGAATDQEIIVEGVTLLTQGTLLKFSRDQESEADRQGLKYMTAAGYDPEGMAEVLQILDDASKGSRPPEILSSHPDPARRLRDVRAALAGPYRETQGNPAYSKYPERFERDAAPHLH